MSISSYMNLKSFHPGNFFNQRKVWIAEQKAEADKKKKTELEQQYKLEQHELAVKTQLLGEDTRKLELNFMYKEPPGLKEAQEKLTLRKKPPGPLDEKDGKKSLQEKHPALQGAPREGSYTDAMATVRDRPFGVEVRNVQCVKCTQWGHQSGDRVCPKYYENGPRDGSEKEIDRPAFQDPATLIKQMREDQGLALRRSVIGRQNNILADNQQLVLSEEEDEAEDPELAFLKTLSAKEKRKLLRKLAKMEGDDSGGGSKSSKKKKKKSRKSKRRHSSSDDSDSSSEEDRPSKRKKSAHDDTSDQGARGRGDRESQVRDRMDGDRHDDKGGRQRGTEERREEEEGRGGRDRENRGHERRREERDGGYEERRRETGDGREERRGDRGSRHESRREERETKRDGRGDERDERRGDSSSGRRSHRDRH